MVQYGRDLRRLNKILDRKMIKFGRSVVEHSILRKFKIHSTEVKF